MKKNYILPLLLFGMLGSTFAQTGNVGIGTNTPDISSMLDITSSDKGLLIPRISIGNVSTFGLSGGTSTAGMVVYNTNASITSGYGVGFYYWSGSAWTKIATGNPVQATLSDGKVWIGNASNVPTEQTISGDATISNAGVLDLTDGAVETSEIADNAVTTVKIADNAVDGTKINITGNANGDLMYYDGTDWVRLASGTTGQILTTNGAAAPTWKTPNSVMNRYTLPNTAGTAQWIKVGTLTISQEGNSAYIKVVSNTGYNASIDQNYEVHIRFKTSNGGSVDANGFAGDGSYYVTGRNANFITANSIKWKANAAGVSATAYDLFMYFGPYTGSGSFYEVESTEGTWVHSGTIGTDPGAASSSVLIPIQEFNVGASSLVVKNENTFIKKNILVGQGIVTGLIQRKVGPGTSTDGAWHTVELDNGYGGTVISAYATGSYLDGEIKIQGVDISDLLDNSTIGWYTTNTANVWNSVSTTKDASSGLTGDSRAYMVYCPNDYIATGWQAWANNNLDHYLKLRCTKLKSVYGTVETGEGIESVMSSPRSTSDNITHFSACPAGTFIKGLSIYANTYLDGNLTVYCTGIKVK